MKKVLLWSLDLRRSKQVWLYPHGHVSASCTCFWDAETGEMIIEQHPNVFLPAHINALVISFTHRHKHTRLCLPDGLRHHVNGFSAIYTVNPVSQQILLCLSS